MTKSIATKDFEFAASNRHAAGHTNPKSPPSSLAHRVEFDNDEISTGIGKLSYIKYLGDFPAHPEFDSGSNWDKAGLKQPK